MMRRKGRLLEMLRKQSSILPCTCKGTAAIELALVKCSRTRVAHTLALVIEFGVHLRKLINLSDRSHNPFRELEQNSFDKSVP
mmetsp:Transcript_44143/g.69912  ORF Transcript_44143/g.69912 Transcript_44143/m.69912 type:complete len:83 (+) Transcript_44143:12-260(+)